MGVHLRISIPLHVHSKNENFCFSICLVTANADCNSPTGVTAANLLSTCSTDFAAAKTTATTCAACTTVPTISADGTCTEGTDGSTPPVATTACVAFNKFRDPYAALGFTFTSTATAATCVCSATTTASSPAYTYSMVLGSAAVLTNQL